MKKVRKMVTYCLIGTLAFASRPTITKAAEVPIAGIDLVLNDFYQNNNNAETDISDYLSSIYTGISFAQVRNYVNIRSAADENSDIVGKLYNNSAATVLDSKDDWYKVKSGSVTGYIKSDYLIIGQEAEKLSKTLGTKIATVTTTTLKVRKDASTDSSVLTLVPIDEDLKVLKEQNGWVKVSVDSNTAGYVSEDFVKLKNEYEMAVSIEEEQARLAAEEAANTNTEKSYVQKSSSNSNSSNQSSSTSSLSIPKTNSSSSNSSSIRDKIVNYAQRFLGNPYVWGGTSLTYGADCSGFTQSVFGDYGIYIPRTSQEQAYEGNRVSVDNIRPGDLVFYAKYGSINHVALYIGNGQVISASSPSTGIRITNLYYRDPVKVVDYID